MARKKELKNLAKDHEVEDFQEYIVNSLINGQQSQCKELYKQMSYNDRVNFIEVYLQDYSDSVQEELRELLTVVKY